MKPNSIVIATAFAALAALPLQSAWAQQHASHAGGGHGASMRGASGGGGWHGGGGGSHGGGWHGGGGGWHGGGGGWHGGWHGGGGGWHGGYWGPSLGIYLGAPWLAGAWGYPYYGGYPDYGSYPYYSGSTIIYDDPAPAYWGPSGGPPGATVIPAPAINPAPRAARPAAQFRYYCPDGGYYPDVRTCPRGWVQQPQT